MAEPTSKRDLMDEDRLDCSERRLIERRTLYQALRSARQPAYRSHPKTGLMIKDYGAELGERR